MPDMQIWSQRWYLFVLALLLLYVQLQHHLHAGASAPVAAGMAILCGTSAAASAGLSLVKHFNESDLMKTASEVIKKDQRAKERLQAAAKTIRALASNFNNTIQFLEKAAQIGVITTKEVNAVLKLAGTAKGCSDCDKGRKCFR
jgi:TRAP-type uncharacterized transport system fused permease subunit